MTADGQERDPMPSGARTEREQGPANEASIRYLRQLAENARAEIAAIGARPPNLMTPAERRSAIRTQEQTLANIRSQLAALGNRDPEDPANF